MTPAVKNPARRGLELNASIKAENPSICELALQEKEKCLSDFLRSGEAMQKALLNETLEDVRWIAVGHRRFGESRPQATNADAPGRCLSGKRYRESFNSCFAR
jgi:hypothetical protein